MTPHATYRLTRRSAIRSLTAGATALAFTSVRTPRTLLAAGAPILGSAEADFEAEFGQGTAIENGLVQYGSLSASAPAYFVRYADDAAEFIEADFSAYEKGGRPMADAEIGQSRFLPEDAALRVQLYLGGASLGQSRFTISTFTSESLATATGRSGQLLMVDESVFSTDQGGMEEVYPRANISMEATDGFQVTPQGSNAQIGAPISGWEQVYGTSEIGQTATNIKAEGLGTILLNTDDDANVREADVRLEAPLSITDAVEYVNASLPADSDLIQTHWLSPTTAGPVGVRVQIYQSPAVPMQFAVLMYVEGGEENGSVSRIIIGWNNYEPLV